MTLRAYAVLEKDEMTGGIYFATKSIYAAKAGADEYADGELGGVQCRRAPWADEYAETGVPARVAVDHGWRFECSGCEVTVNEDMEALEGLPLDGIIGTVSGAVYCSCGCKDRAMRREEERQAEVATAIEDFKAIVRRRLPDVEFADDEDRFKGHHAHIEERDGIWHRSQVIVSFRYPGMTVGCASFQMDRHHRIGPPDAGYRCYAGDREAFEAYMAATKTPERVAA